MKGKKLYNNGKINKQFYEGEQPEGWVPGLVPRSKEQIEAANEKRKRTNVKKYGVENPSQSEDIKDKKKETSLKNYGVENISQAQDVKDKKKQSCLEHYGVESPLKSIEIQEKVKQTNLERYGTEYTLQSEEVKSKICQTNLERYGTEHPMQSEEVKERTKQTNLERYGVKYVLQSEEVKDKIKQTNLERYGTEYPMQSACVQEKSKQTMLERYGVEHALQSSEIKKKQESTLLERYGVENPSQSEEIKEKKRQTSLKHYGTEYPNQSAEVRDRIKDAWINGDAEENRKKTVLARYGVENVFQSEEVKEKIKKSIEEKYGVEYRLLSDEVKAKARRTSQEHYGTDHPFQSEEVKEKIKQTNLERYGVPYYCMLNDCRPTSSINSEPNKRFAILLENNGILYEREFHISHFSYDFKVGNTLIEINPYPYHNSLWNPFGENGVSSDYHKGKSSVAEEAGFRVIHIFDWDSAEKVAYMLRYDASYLARDLVVMGVPGKEVIDFLNTYHLQGTCNGQEVRLGLYCGRELISIMTFGKPRYNKNYQWELLRYASSSLVTGGAQKLFTHFVRDYSPESIISYCDRSKFRGDVYKKLGFSLLRAGEPSKHWFNPKTGMHFTDNLVRQKGVDILLRISYGKGTSNVKLMIEHGFLPIYDCGQDTYTWNE